jgi:hypothetical protein
MHSEPEVLSVFPVIAYEPIAGPAVEGGEPTVGFVLTVMCEPTEEYPDGIIKLPGYVLPISQVQNFCRNLTQAALQISQMH